MEAVQMKFSLKDNPDGMGHRIEVQVVAEKDEEIVRVSKDSIGDVVAPVAMQQCVKLMKHK